MNNTPDPIRDILEQLQYAHNYADDKEPYLTNQIDEAEQALNAYILGEVMELIGEDERSHTLDVNGSPSAVPDYWEFVKNSVRKELRNKAIKKFGGK
jgi:uncharacterized protein with HEPN domain